MEPFLITTEKKSWRECPSYGKHLNVKLLLKTMTTIYAWHLVQEGTEVTNVIIAVQST